MKFTAGKFPIVKKQNIAKNIYDFTILCPDVVKIAKPGQFVHIKADGFMLRRPISICKIDKEKGTLRIVFEIRGDGTDKIASLNVGENIDMIAPLGNGFTMLDKSKTVVCIGGGIGVPPMLEVASHYGENGIAITGFRSIVNAILTDDFKNQQNEVVVCTDDGSMGQKGLVTAPLEQILKTKKIDMICACGPTPMLKGIAKLADQYNVPCEISLEERMACGVGACLGCACKIIKDGVEYNKHVCTDGPVFNSKEVVL
ncbi:MAG: dihydroorotate dehydrogenase electron transfer subunit [Oscillospiraceae bacterium]|nr:dihydroorotate dehydrogenase electron transfer subunit [Oscillospiraceae bacterium]